MVTDSTEKAEILSNQLNEILVEEQYRFRSNHSCESQLFLSIDDLTRALGSKLQVDVAILDFEKVYNKVAHAKLTHKPHHYGISANLL